MKEEIVAKVIYKGEDDVKVIVRKAVFQDDGTLCEKYGLNTTGEWLRVENNCVYPSECYLPVEVAREEEEPIGEVRAFGSTPAKAVNKCPECNGQKIIEKAAGLISYRCRTCNGTGEVAIGVTKEQFEKNEARAFDITVEELREKGLVAVPCDCYEDGCPGWCMEHRETKEVADGDGLVMPDAPNVNTRDDVLTLKNLDKMGDSLCIGLLFRLAGERESGKPDKDLWMMLKHNAAKKMTFPYVSLMPCGNNVKFRVAEDFLDLETKDIPCPCGNPNHYMIKFEDMREVADGKPDDNGDDTRESLVGDRPDSPVAGSSDAGKPKQPPKRKAKAKTRKRSR